MSPFDSFYINDSEAYCVNGVPVFNNPIVFQYEAEAYKYNKITIYHDVYDYFEPSSIFSEKTGIKNLRIWTD